MNPFYQALNQGHSVEEIIKYLSKAIPSMAEPIRKASHMGYTSQQILGYLSKAFSPRDIRGKSESEIHAENRMNDTQMVKHGLTIAATSLAAPVAANAARTALQRALPTSLQQLGNISPQLPPNGNVQVNPSSVPQKTGQQITPSNILPTSQQPPVSPNIAQSQTVAQPEVKINPREYLEKLGVKDSVDTLLAAGNSPEQAATIVSMKVGKGKRGKTKSEIDPELLANIDAYAKTAQEQPQERAPVEQPSQKLDESKEVERKPIAKNETVASPHGVGEVKEIRNGQAIIDVDGKKHQVEEKSLLKPPKEAAIEALELIKGFTPEEMRSTHHMLNAYDEGEKKGFFVFHNGSAYVVDDISPEEYIELSEEIEKAKTNGETIIGQWAAGEGSRGAAYNKIVKGVRERKVVPELKKKFRKLKVGYNLLAEWQKLLGEHEKDLRSQRNQASE